MERYNTKQRSALTEYFEKRADESLSSGEIIEALAKTGMSRSAVYRNLAELEKEGKIRRVVKTGERAAYYQYVAHEHCKNKIHISCIKCGKTGHISGNMADIIAEGIKNEDDFLIDKEETVLYGICKNCKGAL